MDPAIVGLGSKRRRHGRMAGIADAQGVPAKKVFPTPPGSSCVKILAAKASQKPELTAYSNPQGAINRLEQAIRDKCGVLNDEATWRVCCEPITCSSIRTAKTSLAGPAEGWPPTRRDAWWNHQPPANRPVAGSRGGLRAFEGQPATKVIGCSIDATKEGLAAMQEHRAA